MTTTTETQAETLLRLLVIRRSNGYDERAAEFSRRQAVLDVAAEGRSPDLELNMSEQAMFDDHSHRIRQLDTEIDALTLIIDRASAELTR